MNYKYSYPAKELVQVARYINTFKNNKLRDLAKISFDGLLEHLEVIEEIERDNEVI